MALLLILMDEEVVLDAATVPDFVPNRQSRRCGLLTLAVKIDIFPCVAWHVPKTSKLNVFMESKMLFLLQQNCLEVGEARLPLRRVLKEQDKGSS